MIIFIVTVAPF